MVGFFPASLNVASESSLSCVTAVPVWRAARGEGPFAALVVVWPERCAASDQPSSSDTSPPGRFSRICRGFSGIVGAVFLGALSGGGRLCRSRESLPEPVARVALEPELEG